MGRLDFPDAAQKLAVVTHIIERSRADDAGAFRELDGSHHPATTAWLQMRDSLQQIVHTSCINLQDTGSALVAIANAYAATDEEAANVFEDKRDNLYAADYTSQLHTAEPVAPRRPGNRAAQ
ncbi:hypothetical protein [Natronoglycomyces albus]|uniref:Uncharacterized protein n=1 Tax=Natronoglycomyces albus TaxID=2811108 RepID=A0A895XP17_9ACTN|nr:hypothetical protein [Natronoglycomyces albus]QSB05129.1 hypothetical protein JQS30_15430 [Natronoglycomyces albus]